MPMLLLGGTGNDRCMYMRAPLSCGDTGGPSHDSARKPELCLNAYCHVAVLGTAGVPG